VNSENNLFDTYFSSSTVLKKIYKPFILFLATLYLIGLYFYLSNQVHQEKMGLRYEATLLEGIDFTKPGYPLFLKNVTGLSIPEEWGRWSDAKDAGSRVIFEFNEPLPQRFTLEMTLRAYGSNQTQPIKVIVGNTIVEFLLNPTLPNEVMQMIKLEIVQSTQNTLSKTIEIVIPKPTAPPKPVNFNPSYPVGVDQRWLGVGISKLRLI
jgi:phosphoglycerol transferase